MLGWRGTSRDYDKFCELSSAVFAFRCFEISDVDVGTFAELFPLALQLKRRNPAHQQTAYNKYSGSALIKTFVQVRIHVAAILTFCTNSKPILPVSRLQPSPTLRLSPSLASEFCESFCDQVLTLSLFSVTASANLRYQHPPS